MWSKKISCYIIVCFIVIACSGNNSSSKDRENNSGTAGYEDGIYSASVDYYYYKTGTSSTYTLDVEIEDNMLTVIHWPNGGWLDSSHFTPVDISEGEASFTSDEGAEYTVRIE